MALTDQDLQNIEGIVSGSMAKLEVNLASVELNLTRRLKRMERRLTDGIDLLQRDGFDRLEDHERRITKLEQSKQP